MSLLWIAGRTAFVLLERILPYGALACRVAGWLAVFVGGLFLALG